MKNNTVDNGQVFDFGRTASEYAKYRDIYPLMLSPPANVFGISVLI